jgi:hypothetical protein
MFVLELQMRFLPSKILVVETSDNSLSVSTHHAAITVALHWLCNSLLLQRTTTFQLHTNCNTDQNAADLQADVSENINFPTGPVLQD